MSTKGGKGGTDGSALAGSAPASPPSSEVLAFHERLVRQGASVVERHGRPAAARFEEVELEHGRLSRTAGLLDQTDRVVVEVSGRRAHRMLTGLLTNELPPAGEARAVYTFLLTAKGRPVAEARAVPLEENVVWLDVPAACARGLLEHLGRTLPPLYARFEPRPEIVGLGLVGPRSEEALNAWTGESDRPPGDDLPPLALWRRAADGEEGPLVVRREPDEGPGFDLYVEAGDLERTWAGLLGAVEAAGGGAAGREAYEIWRVERGIPAYGSEIGPDTLPQETGQQGRAISLSKGCYTGQEVVARIHYRGHVNRHLRGLRPVGASDGEPFSAGETLYREGRGVGSVTSAALSPRLGPIALGYVRREVGPGERLGRAPDGPPTVEVVKLPFTSR